MGFVFDDGTGARAVSRRESALAIRILDGLVEEWEASDREKRIWFRMKVRILGIAGGARKASLGRPVATDRGVAM